MNKTIFLTFCFGAKVSHYDKYKDIFIFSDSSQKDLSSKSFILNLKTVLDKKGPSYNTIKNNIRNYEKAIE